MSSRKTLLQLVPTSFQVILVVAIPPKGSDAGPIEGFRCNPTRAGRFYRATEMFTCFRVSSIEQSNLAQRYPRFRDELGGRKKAYSSSNLGTTMIQIQKSWLPKEAILRQETTPSIVGLLHVHLH